MAKGKVKFFNSEKGYGFITPNGGGKDIFFHYSKIQKDGYKKLEEWEEVEYEVGTSDRGPAAENVRSI